MVVYVVTTGDQILIDDRPFQSEHNVEAVYTTMKQAQKHLRQFIINFYEQTPDPLKWLHNNYLPCSNPEKGLGIEFTLSTSAIKTVNRKIYCQYEEVEVSEEA